MIRNVLLLLMFVALVAACGDRGSSQDQNANLSNQYQPRVGYGYGDPYYSQQGNGGPSYSSGTGGDTVTGTGPNGTLSTAEIQGLQDTLSRLPSEDRSQVQYVLLADLRQCSFPPAAAATAAACRMGYAQACGQLIGGYVAGYLNKMGQQLGMNVGGTDTTGSQQDCAAVDMDNATAVQTFIDREKQMCQQGNRRACLGLLRFLARMFLRSLLLAFALLTA